jgi:hypothetical protein
LGRKHGEGESKKITVNSLSPSFFGHLADNQCGYQSIGHKSHNEIKMTVNGGESGLGILPGIFFGEGFRFTAFAGSPRDKILGGRWVHSRD